MTKTFRMAIVPAEATERMTAEIESFDRRGIERGEAVWDSAVSEAPNAGKISRADLKRALSDARTAGLRAIADQPEATDMQEQICAHARAEEDALAAALRLEIAEDESDG